MEIVRLKNVEDVDPGTWNDLLQHNETNEVFLTYQWVTCWWNYVRKNNKLLVLMAKEGGACVGIAPLMLTPRRVGPVTYTAVEFLGTGESDYTDFIIKPERKSDVLRAFIAFIDSVRDEWDVISLQNIPETSKTVPELRSLLKDSKYGLRALPDVICPALIISADEEFARACTNKKSLRRHYNYFNRKGLLTFSTIDSLEEVTEFLPEFFQQHMDRRAIAGGVSKFRDKQIREFYQCLANKLLAQDWLRFSVVKFDEIPIAFHFGFEYFGKFVWYKPTFNTDYLKKSPGEVLIKFLLEDAIAKNLDEFDFTIGNEAFKQRFANVERVNHGVEAVKNRHLFLLLNFTDWFKAFAKRHMPGPYSFLKKRLGPR